MIRKPNFKLNWKYALGEVLLIFIGISLAVAFQNWNEQRVARQKEQHFLNELKSNLEQDIEQLDQLYRLLKARKERAQSVLDILGDIPKEIDTAALITNVERSGWFFTFRPNLSTYNEIISTGSLDLIRSDTLKERLSFYKTRTENGLEIDRYNARNIKDFESMIPLYVEEGLGAIDMVSPNPTLYKNLSIDLKGMSRDKVLISKLRSVVNHSNSEIAYKQDLIEPLINELIEIVVNELNQ